MTERPCDRDLFATPEAQAWHNWLLAVAYGSARVDACQSLGLGPGVCSLDFAEVAAGVCIADFPAIYDRLAAEAVAKAVA
jgi:hypothetical protein